MSEDSDVIEVDTPIEVTTPVQIQQPDDVPNTIEVVQEEVVEENMAEEKITPVADLMTSTDQVVISNAVTELLAKCRAANDYETPQAFQRLARYIDIMTDSASKGIVTEETGALQQLEMLRAVTQIYTATPGELFRSAYTLFLATIKDNIDGCFSTTMWARFLDNNVMDREQKNMFTRVMNLLVRTCRTDRKMIAKQVDIARTLEGFDENAVSRVTNFYRD